MIIYLFKVIACSALFYAFYFLLLRNEKMLLFNRVYLLSTLIAAFLMPRATITVKQPVLPVAVTELRVVEEPGWQEALFYWSLVLFMVVSFLLMIRLVRNLLKISHSVQSYPHVWWRGTRVVLVGQPVMAHSFLKNIFLSKEEFEHGDIEEEVLEHEWAHVRQRHSWDILFIELLQTVSWFNPVIYLYKRSIKINHELLADAAVIKRRGNIRNYQHILLQRAGARPSLALARSFNFFITKKRLIMLQKKTNPIITGLKALLVLPLLALLLFIFGERVYAQVPPPPPPPKEPVKAQELPDNIESLKIITPKGKPYAILKYRNGTTVKEAINGPQKQAFEKKYGVKIPPPPPPPPAPIVEVDKLEPPVKDQTTAMVQKVPKESRRLAPPKVVADRAPRQLTPPTIVKDKKVQPVKTAPAIIEVDTSL